MRGFATLLVAGAAVGAAGAAVARRRRAQQAEWEEYDPVTGETRYYGAASRYADEGQSGRRSPRERMASGMANVADSLSSRAGRVADSLHERTESMQGGLPGATAQPGQNVPPRTTGQMTGPSGTGPGMPASGVNPMPGAPTARNMGDPALGFPEAP
jgi:type IV secretory pathway TrbL component